MDGQTWSESVGKFTAWSWWVDFWHFPHRKSTKKRVFLKPIKKKIIWFLWTQAFKLPYENRGLGGFVDSGNPNSHETWPPRSSLPMSPDQSASILPIFEGNQWESNSRYIFYNPFPLSERQIQISCRTLVLYRIDSVAVGPFFGGVFNIISTYIDINWLYIWSTCIKVVQHD